MSYNDPISDLLTIIRNGKMAQHRYVDVIISKIKLSIVKILKEKGFIENYIVNDEKRKIRVFLKYTATREAVIQGLKRLSKPGLRRYTSYQKIPQIFGGMGLMILSTSQGVIDGEEARALKVGGELLCCVW